MNVLLIGATSGIGRDMALWFAKRGHSVLAMGRRWELLETLKSENDNITTKVFDVDDIENTKHFFSKLKDIDLVVISSGIGRTQKGTLLDWELEQATIKTNTEGWTAIIDFAYNYFKEKGKGHIAAITSVASLVPSIYAPAYSATKIYQTSYLDSLSWRSWKEKANIKITELRPGWVDTPMTVNKKMFWVINSGKAADICCKAILKKKRLCYISPRWAILCVPVKLISIFK